MTSLQGPGHKANAPRPRGLSHLPQDFHYHEYQPTHRSDPDTVPERRLGFWRRAALAKIACRSVHLNVYRRPRQASAYMNSVSVETSAPGTYFCVAGFNHGYFGIQELADGKKLAIFSVWDPGKQDDPKTVEADRRVKLIDKDPETRTGRFGNEGTGGQSFLDLDWTPGSTYRFLVTARPEGERTTYSAYLAIPSAERWRLIAAFSTITGGEFLKGYYGFIEDFKRNRESATQERRASFGLPGSATCKDSVWSPLVRAKFTADRNPSTCHRRR